MNLPEKNLEFIPDIKHFVKPNGTVLIIYLFAPKIDPFQEVISKLKSVLERNEMKLKRIINKRLVNKYSPQIFKVVLDVLILKNKV
jgi:tRNA G37 N-methylase Trm5